jgi:Icc-related predicted phosphoesterase
MPPSIPKPKPRRLLFATDLHGSTAAFRKLLDAPATYGVDALVCAGDLAGKRLFPIVKGANGRHVLYDGAAPQVLDGHAALADVRAALETSGGYPVTLSADEHELIARDPSARRRLLERAIRARLEEWVALAEDRLRDTGVTCHLAGGNNDAEDTLALLRDSGSDAVIASEGRVVDVLGLPMVSLGWSNPTPWGTPRETSEEQLEIMLRDAIAELDEPRRAIFNLHAPPKSSRLDRCARLDTTMRPPQPILRGGKAQMHAAGSRAVGDAIRAHQPVLGLHGHIHESPGARRIGRTVCINPGSEYHVGALLGAVVALAPGKVVSYQLTRA